MNVTNFGKRGVEIDEHCFVDRCQQGWIRVDGRVVAHSDHGRLRVRPPAVSGRQQSQALLFFDPYQGAIDPGGAEVGTFMELTEACWEYLHSSVSDSLRSVDPFVSALAVLNAKVGRTRLHRADKSALHPLTRAMLEFRLEAERRARELSAA